MAIDWPSVFPAPEVGFAASFSPTVDLVLMDSGEHRQRPVRRGGNYLLQASIALNGANLSLFHAWFKYHLLDGVESINMELPIDGDPTETEVWFTESKYQVRLKEAPSTWEIQMQLETFI